MNLFDNPLALDMTRRHFFRSAGFSLGATALATLAGPDRVPTGGTKTGIGAALPETHFPAKCKNIIYLHMVGGPAQMDLYDYKPKMQEYYDKDLPDSIRMGQRLTTMTSGQARFPIAPSKYKFKQKGKCGMWMNDELLPYTREDGRRHGVHPLDAHRGDQPRAGHHVHADRQPGHRPAVPRGVDQLRPRQPQPEPADVRGHGRQAEQPGAGAGDLGPAVAVGLPARRARGRVVPLGRRPDPVHQQPAGRHARGPPHHPRRAEQAQRACTARRARRPRDARPAWPSTRWRTGCRRACRNSPTWRRSRRRCSTCTART